MDDSDIEELHEKLEKQDLMLRELRISVNSIMDFVTVYQAFFAIHAAEPDFFHAYKPDELLKLMNSKTKTVRQKIDLLRAAQRRRSSGTSSSSDLN